MRLECQAIIFDLDGVLVDSVPGILSIWRAWAKKHGIENPDLNHLAITARTEEAVQHLAPDLDLQTEVEYLEEQEATGIRDLRPIKGARSLIDALPPDAWGVFTSVSQKTALSKMQIANLPQPRVLVSGDRVLRGKPYPDGYLLASRELGVEPRECLVIEDTPLGVQAARAAGIPVIALTTTHSPDQLVGAQAVVSDLEAIRVSVHKPVYGRTIDNLGNRSIILLSLKINPQA